MSHDNTSPHTEFKRCPYCAEEIKAAAIVCRYCGRDLTKKVSPNSIGIIEIVWIVAALFGAYSILFGPWPFYREGTYAALTFAEIRDQGGIAWIIWQLMYHPLIRLVYVYATPLLGAVLAILTLVSEHLRARVLPWGWLFAGLLGLPYPLVVLIGEHIVNEGHLLRNMSTPPWGLYATLICYGAILLTAVTWQSRRVNRER